MQRNLSLLLLVILSFLGIADALAQPARTVITGKIVEGAGGNPIEFATVLLGEKVTEKALSGTTTDQNGEFALSTDATDFYVDISFIGFETMRIDQFESRNGRINLGVIQLLENTAILSEVTVRAERSQTEFKLDKRVFNVGQDLSSSGASALEVLNNVPSVTVSIEGDISLRGNQGVQILLNGKPSVLAEGGNALGSITADMIDRIEVITNPSAKYDAEGTTGILNIVLKKEEKKGLNGSVTVNTGIPNNHSVGLSLNRRTEKFNLFSQIGIGHRTFPNDSESLNQNRITGTNIANQGTSDKNETFYNFNLGTDYHINKNNVVTLSGSFAYEKEKELSHSLFEIYENNSDPTIAWNRSELTTASNPKFQYEFQYKKDHDDHEDHDLLFSAIGRFFGKDQQSAFNNTTVIGNIESLEQDVRSDFKNANYTFKLDYTKPISDNWTIETGAQYMINDVGNDYEVQDFIDGIWLVNPNLTNNFEFNQDVLGIYATTAYEGNKWGMKGGIRLEQTALSTLLTTTGADSDQDYLNLFPSVHTSYKFTTGFSMQAGYSRRIFRPRMWDLNPFFNIRNNFNVRTGNPNLRPEFTDSYEFNAIFVGDDVSLNAGIYHRYTTDAVERVTVFEENVSTTIPLNIGTTRTNGLELNGKYTPTRKLTLSGDFNYNLLSRKGEFQDSPIDFSADYWTSRLMAKFKLPADIDLEIAGNYRSRVQTFQSVYSANTFADIGIRKKLMNGRTILNLSVRDIFASRFREGITDQDDFYVYSYGQRGRFVTLGISYGFGKGEAMEFSSKRHH